MEKEQITQLLNKQRQYFYTGATLSIDFRISALKRLKAAIRKHESQINAALKKDLGKSNFESNELVRKPRNVPVFGHLLITFLNIATPRFV